jgi:crotonobetainyl-CoA:carnitine CoA-transferase CaiB-like acyl-CoA transferase
VAQRENLINMIGEQVVGYSLTGREPPRRGNRHTSMAPHGCYPCEGDDQWVAIACQDDAQFASLCETIGRPELARDARFADVVSRYRNQRELDPVIAGWTAPRSKEEAAIALQEAGVPAMPVLAVPEVFADEHLRARGFFEHVAHAVAGVWDIDAPHWRMSETPPHVRLPAPAFSEHNRWVFGELLGLGEEEVAALYRDGITGDAPDWSVHE